MVADKDFNIQVADWFTCEEDLKEIRTKVFIEEQNIPFNEEFDDADLTSVHVLARDQNNNAIGTARLLITDTIGRVAVLKAWRGNGVGRALVLYLMEMARNRGAARIYLDAQNHAIPFYERLGFRVVGREFLDAGIPHFKMAIDFS